MSSNHHPSHPAVDEATIEDAYPLSPMQRGMLFNTLSDPRSGVDIEQVDCALQEALHVAAFQRAWRCVMARHAVLRTSLRWENVTEPQQEVSVEVALPWEEQDWSRLPTSERDERLDEFLSADRRRGFDLTRAPLFRLTLLRYGTVEFHIVWTLHHTILDGHSLELVLREVFAFYEAFYNGVEISLALPRPYRDYINWFRQQDFSADAEFWRQTLRDFTNPTALTITHTFGDRQDGKSRKGTWEVRLCAEHTSVLRKVAQDNQLTLNTIVQGAWAWLLSCYSGEADVVLGVIRSTRRSAIEGADAMVGLFLATLPLRIRIDREMEVTSWLREIRRNWMAMRGHEHMPLASVQAGSGVPAGRQLFEATIMFENSDLDTRLREQPGNWSNRRFRQFSQTNYPLDVAAYDGTELRLRIDFDRTRIEQGVAQGIANQLCTLLEAIATNPSQRVGELRLLRQAERHRLLEEWNQPHSPWSPGLTLQTLFERQAERTPGRIAARFADQHMTYRELNSRANQLARYLRGLNVGPDVLVGVCAQRSLEMVVGLLGVLKAGGAFVPIDPSYPAERIALMLNDARAPVLLVQEGLIRSLPTLGDTRLVSLDDPRWNAPLDNDDNLLHTGDDSHLAYVIYTSGSTGTPKGVMIPHRGIVNHLLWMQSTFPMDECDCVLQKTEFGFDVSVWEIFAPLVFGARLVVARPGGHQDPGYLVDTIVQQKVTILQLVPTLLRMLVEHPEFGSCRSLRHIFCGGEAMRGDLPSRVYAALECEVHNMYGPTEVTIDSLYYSVPRHHSGTAVPIGRPILNTRAYVLDRWREPVPIGVPGELYLGGIQLARGYHGQPDRTAESFVPDPFSDAPEARLYRTGDRVRYLPDGTIEFLGRVDEQVKVRGFRIELAEIECALRGHPAVRECVVALREDIPGDKRLVAYVVAATSSRLPEKLRRFLKRRLPVYMVPSAFVRLATLPLSPNGKVDRTQLPAPEVGSEPSEAYVAPRTQTEKALTSTWSKLLGQSQVGVQDNFFDLGGDSLLLVELLNEMNKVQNVSLTVPDLIQNPTVEQLAALIDTWQPARARLSKIVPFHEGHVGLPMYFIFARTAELRLASQLDENWRVYGIEAVWPLAWRDAVAQRRTSAYPTMEQLVNPYVEALIEHGPTFPCVLAGFSFAGLMAFEAAHQIQKLGGQVELIILVDSEISLANPYQIAWGILRQDWQASPNGHASDHPSHSIAARMRKAWQTSWWLLRKARNRALSLFSRPEEDLGHATGLFDEQGKHLSFGVVNPVYDQIEKSYRPRPLDCRGVLFRTETPKRTFSIRGYDDSLGWKGLFARGLEIRPLAGDHYGIFREQIPPLAREIDELLRGCASDQGGGRLSPNARESKRADAGAEVEKAAPLSDEGGDLAPKTAEGKSRLAMIEWICIGVALLLPWVGMND